MPIFQDFLKETISSPTNLTELFILKFTRQQLIDAGWQDNAELDHTYLHALTLIGNKSATTTKYLFKLLKRDFPDQHASLQMRDEPAPLELAIEAETKDEIKNLNKATKQITELLRCPVVSAGALMPDACPAGSAPASMPVGGAISVENAIIPAAHSADICCSLHASFYHTELTAAEQIDTLMKETRFGPVGVEIRKIKFTTLYLRNRSGAIHS